MSFFAISALINAILSITLGSLILARDFKNRVYILFALFAFSIAGWSLAYFFWQTSESADVALLWSRTFMMFATLIPFFYFHFVCEFTNLVSKHYLSIIFGYIFAFTFSFLSWSDLFITSVSSKGQFEYWPEPGLFFFPFLVIWFFYVLYATILLAQSYKNAVGQFEAQIRFILFGMVVGYIGGSTNYFLWYDINIPPYGNILVSFYVLMVSYAIARHRLFDLKVIATEILVLSLWIFAFIRTSLSTTYEDFGINAGFLIGTFAIGIFLILNVKKEVEIREQVEKLAAELQKANSRLKELDKMKSEFVSIASHQLRSPITVLRGYASMLLEGSFGKFPAKAREALERINESSRYMALSIEDYLNVSRIESGNMKYEITEFNIKDVTKNIVDGMRSTGFKKGLLLTFESKVKSGCIVKADTGKVRQIIQNLIDNAIKYTKKGSITVSIRDQIKPRKIFVDIADTGVGISKEELNSVFQKFERARNANEMNVTGTGLGLFIARKMAEDMGGTVTAQSEGTGKGSTFTLELPLVR